MAKIATLAGGAGVLTGLLAVVAWFGGLTALHGSWATVTLALAVVLVVVSLAAFAGPRVIFYSSALLAALLLGSDWIGSRSDAPAVTLLIAVASFVTLVLAIVAAKFEPEVSEQSNPMNLPVFG